MSGRFNNRVLLIIFIVLAAIFLVMRFTTVRRSDRTLHTDLVSIDTSLVSTVILSPASETGTSVTFEKAGGSWSVASGGINARASASSVRTMLAGLSRLETDQLVARSRENWEEFQVNDSLGTRVVLKSGERTLLDLVVGKFSYQQAAGGYNMYGQDQGIARSYIRLSDETEVYSVEGFLAMTLNQPFENWRDQTVARINISELSRIVFDYPADSGFVAERTVGGWTVGGILADSTSMVQYINQLSWKRNSTFDDTYQPSSDADYSITFEGENMDPQRLLAYRGTGEQFFLTGSSNPGTVFRSATEGLFGEIFTWRGKLIAGEPE